MAKNGGQVNMLVVDGGSQLLTTRHVGTILGISWGTFIISWITNAVYYKVRNMNSLSIIIMCFIFILRLDSPEQSRGVYDKEQTPATCFRKHIFCVW